MLKLLRRLVANVRAYRAERARRREAHADAVRANRSLIARVRREADAIEEANRMRDKTGKE